jgi:hypothetical protein
MAVRTSGCWPGTALSEYWIHRQQLLQGLGRPSDLRTDLAEPVLDGLRWPTPTGWPRPLRSREPKWGMNAPVLRSGISPP